MVKDYNYREFVCDKCGKSSREGSNINLPKNWNLLQLPDISFHVCDECKKDVCDKIKGIFEE